MHVVADYARSVAVGIVGWVSLGILAGHVSAAGPAEPSARASEAKEVLYNGIVLPETWPPRTHRWVLYSGRGWRFKYGTHGRHRRRSRTSSSTRVEATSASTVVM